VSVPAILLALVGLIVVIMIHELGHFLVARRFGFKIEEYFLGFGPKLWSMRRGEIEYGVKAVVVGGYVKIAGMNPYQPVPPEDIPRAYGSKPPWQRALVIFAGPATHFLIAAILFGAWVGITHVDQYGAGGPPRITSVLATLNGNPSPASVAGLRPGDRIVRVGPVTDLSGDALSNYTTAHIGEPISVTVRRGAQLQTVTATPVAAPGSDGTTIGRLGISIETPFAHAGWADAPLMGARMVGTSVADSWNQVIHVFGPEGFANVFRSLFLGQQRGPRSAQSFIGVGRAVGYAGQVGGLVEVLRILGFVTVFVGLLNLLPLPPFDGGHLAVLLLEKIRGRAVDMRSLIPVSAVVISLLVLLVGATVILDVWKPVPLSP
jgi:membrane-associated protease RseP (regulator of RpoE activity)